MLRSLPLGGRGIRLPIVCSELLRERESARQGGTAKKKKLFSLRLGGRELQQGEAFDTEATMQSLWRLAVRLVSRYGVSRTAQALGVDYYYGRAPSGSTPSSSPLYGRADVEIPDRESSFYPRAGRRPVRLEPGDRLSGALEIKRFPLRAG